ncbi:hypothetical protein NLN85_13590, partial [Citrobacter portucalensis]|uniref:hypothetical protein n=1 Tax=Citrobacter portucalensis TaxID=1639133 RepID=UPI00226B8161
MLDYLPPNKTWLAILFFFIKRASPMHNNMTIKENAGVMIKLYSAAFLYISVCGIWDAILLMDIDD